MSIQLRWQTPLPEAETREQLCRAIGPEGLDLPAITPPEPDTLAFLLDHAIVVARLEASPNGTVVHLRTDTWDPRLLALENWLSPPPPSGPPEAPFPTTERSP